MLKKYKKGLTKQGGCVKIYLSTPTAVMYICG